MYKKLGLLFLTLITAILLTSCTSAASRLTEILASVELSDDNETFSSNMKDATKLSILTDLRFEMYIDETAPIFYSFATAFSLIDYDQANQYIYLQTSQYGLVNTEEMFQVTEDGMVHTYTEGKAIRQEVLGAPDDVYREVFGSTEDEELYIYLSDEDTLEKDRDTGEYTLTVKVTSLSEGSLDFLNQILESNTVEDLIESDLSITLGYLYNEDHTALLFSIDVPRYFDEVYNTYVTLSIESTISVQDSIEIHSIDFDNYAYTGASSTEDTMFLLLPNQENEIYVGTEKDNYYALKLEAGYYVIDNEYRMQNYVDVEVFDGDGNILEGTGIYQIETSGTYYVNFIQKKYSNTVESIYVYQIDEGKVGTPNNPKVITSTAVTVTRSEENSYLLIESAPQDGILILSAPSDTDILAYARLATQGAYRMFDTAWTDLNTRYGFIQVNAGDTVILRFEDGFFGSYEVNWYYQAQEELTNDIAFMPEISLDEPTMIFLTKDGSEVNYKFTALVDGSYTFFQTFDYKQAQWGTYQVSIYDEQMNLIEDDILTNPVDLITGSYIIKISHIDKIHYYPYLWEQSEYNFIIFALNASVE